MPHRNAIASLRLSLPIACAVLWAVPVLAQEAEPRITVWFTPNEAVTRAQFARVEAGIRRGLRGSPFGRYVHAMDAIEKTTPSEVEQAIDKLDSVASAIQAGRHRDAAMQTASIIEVLERNLGSVRRDDLADAYMLRALADCVRGQRPVCEEGFRYVIGFREGMTYDAGRYPRAYEAVFERASKRATERGSIEIRTEPSGAEVFVDGVSLGPSPVVAEGLLVGTHYVTAKAFGYEKAVERVDVSPTEQRTQTVALASTQAGQSLESLVGQISFESGPAVPRGVLEGGRRLGVDRVLVGSVAPAPRGRLRVTMRVFDVGAQRRVAEGVALIPAEGEALTDRVAHAVRSLPPARTPAIAAAPPPAEPEDTPTLWERWWFWTAVGVAVAAGATAGILLSLDTTPDVPSGWTRFDARF